MEEMLLPLKQQQQSAVKMKKKQLMYREYLRSRLRTFHIMVLILIIASVSTYCYFNYIHCKPQQQQQQSSDGIHIISQHNAEGCFKLAFRAGARNVGRQTVNGIQTVGRTAGRAAAQGINGVRHGAHAVIAHPVSQAVGSGLKTVSKKTGLTAAAKGFRRVVQHPVSQTIIAGAEVGGAIATVHYTIQAGSAAAEILELGVDLNKLKDIVNAANIAEIAQMGIDVQRLKAAVNTGDSLEDLMGESSETIMKSLAAPTPHLQIVEGAAALPTPNLQTVGGAAAVSEAVSASESVKEVFNKVKNLVNTVDPVLLAQLRTARIHIAALDVERRTLLLHGMNRLRTELWSSVLSTNYVKLTKRQQHTLGLWNAGDLAKNLDHVDEEIGEMMIAATMRVQDGRDFIDLGFYQRLRNRLDILDNVNLRAVALAVDEEIMESMTKLAMKTIAKVAKTNELEAVADVYTNVRRKLHQFPPGTEDQSRSLYLEVMRDGWKKVADFGEKTKAQRLRKILKEAKKKELAAAAAAKAGGKDVEIELIDLSPETPAVQGGGGGVIKQQQHQPMTLAAAAADDGVIPNVVRADVHSIPSSSANDVSDVANNLRQEEGIRTGAVPKIKKVTIEDISSSGGAKHGDRLPTIIENENVEEMDELINGLDGIFGKSSPTLSSSSSSSGIFFPAANSVADVSESAAASAASMRLSASQLPRNRQVLHNFFERSGLVRDPAYPIEDFVKHIPVSEHELDDLIEMVASDFAVQAMNPNVLLSELEETFRVAVALELRRAKGVMPKTFIKRHKKVIIGTVTILSTAGVFTGLGIELDKLAQGYHLPNSDPSDPNLPPNNGGDDDDDDDPEDPDNSTTTTTTTTTPKPNNNPTKRSTTRRPGVPSKGTTTSGPTRFVLCCRLKTRTIYIITDDGERVAEDEDYQDCANIPEPAVCPRNGTRSDDSVSRQRRQLSKDFLQQRHEPAIAEIYDSMWYDCDLAREMGILKHISAMIEGEKVKKSAAAAAAVAVAVQNNNSEVEEEGYDEDEPDYINNGNAADFHVLTDFDIFVSQQCAPGFETDPKDDSHVSNDAFMRRFDMQKKFVDDGGELNQVLGNIIRIEPVDLLATSTVKAINHVLEKSFEQASRIVTSFVTRHEALINNSHYDCFLAEKTGLLHDIRKVERIGEKMQDLVSLTELDSHIVSRCTAIVRRRTVTSIAANAVTHIRIPLELIIEAKRSVVESSKKADIAIDNRITKKFRSIVNAFYKKYPHYVEGSWYDCDKAEELGIIDDLNRAINYGNKRGITITLLDRYVLSRCYSDSDPETEEGLKFRKTQQKLHLEMGGKKEDIYDEQGHARNLIYINMQDLASVRKQCPPSQRPRCSILE